MPGPKTARGKRSEAADAEGKQRIEGVKGTPSFVEPMRAKPQAAQLSWEDNGDGSWSIVVGNQGLLAAGASFGVFWADDDGDDHYTQVHIES